MTASRVPALAVISILLTIDSFVAGAQGQAPRVRQVPMPVRAACDMAYRVAAKTPGASVRRRTGSFTDETLQTPVFGCGLAIAGSFARAEKTGDASVRLRQALMESAWEEMSSYSADGTDGTSFAFRKGGVACFARGTWDGGADGEPEIPPEDWYKVTFFCTTPVFPEDRF